MNRFLLPLFVWLAFYALPGCSDTNYRVQSVTSGIYYHQGRHQDATAENLGAIANVGFIIGEKCVAVIDAGGSMAEGKRLLHAIREKTALPICYVINTHVHPDHILGNAAFKDEHPVFIGHEKLPAAMMARKDFYQKRFSQILGAAYKGTEFIMPSLTVKVGAPVTLDLGKRKLVLTAYTTAHTDNDLTVLDVNTRTLWTGDLLFITRIPVIDGSINGWIKVIKQLQTMRLDYVVPGHGLASHDKWQQGLKDELHYLVLIRKQIREIINHLGTIEEATHTVGLEEQNKWELFEHYHRRNITAAFVELEWE